jgi:hypothetical protein
MGSTLCHASPYPREHFRFHPPDPICTDANASWKFILLLQPKDVL